MILGYQTINQSINSNNNLINQSIEQSTNTKNNNDPINQPINRLFNQSIVEKITVQSINQLMVAHIHPTMFCFFVFQTWLIIFPEGTRYNPSNPSAITSSQEFAKKSGIGFISWGMRGRNPLFCVFKWFFLIFLIFFDFFLIFFKKHFLTFFFWFFFLIFFWFFKKKFLTFFLTFFWIFLDFFFGFFLFFFWFFLSDLLPMQHVLSPRTKAFHLSQQSLKSYFDAVYDVTVLYSQTRMTNADGSSGRCIAPSMNGMDFASKTFLFDVQIYSYVKNCIHISI